jgi:RHS repeat-associated protein
MQRADSLPVAGAAAIAGPRRDDRSAGHAVKIFVAGLFLWLAASMAWAQSCPATGGGAQCRDTSGGRSTTFTATGAGNPIDVTTGNKYQYETDLEYPGGLAIGFSRHYNSVATGGAALGPGWTHDFETSLSREQRGDVAIVRVYQSDGRVLEFHPAPRVGGGPVSYRGAAPTFGLVEEDAASLERLRRIVGKRATARDGTDASAERPWVWRWPDGRRLTFDGRGRLRAMDERNGAKVALDYDGRGRLAKMRDDAGRELAFDYWDDVAALLDSYGADRRSSQGYAGRLKSIAVPEGGAVAFGYDARGLLTSVRHPDGIQRRYEYVESAGKARLARIFSGDEPIGEYAYDARGRANYSSGDGETVRLDFGKTLPEALTGETRVTNAQGGVTTYRWELGAPTGQRQIVEARGPGCSSCPPGDRRYRFDERGQIRVVESPSAHGARVETTRYDALGRIVSRTEQTGRGEPRLVERLEYASDDPFALPSAVERASVVAGKRHRKTFEYDEGGRLVRAEETGFSPRIDASAGHPLAEPVELRRTTTLRHERKGTRVVLTQIDGPLPGDSDVVRFDWDARGVDLVRVRYPHGVQREWAFDAITGRLSAETPSDGVAIDYRRDARGRVISRTRGDSAVVIRRDERGRPERLDLGDGEILRIAYGGPGSSVAVFSGSGAAQWLRPPSVQTVADVVTPGNPTRDAVERPYAWGTTSLHVDDFGRTLAVTTGATGQERYAYDAADRVVARHFADGTAWKYQRDALGRVIRHTSTDRHGASRETRLDYAGPALESLREAHESVRNERDDRGRVAARTVTRARPDGGELRFTERFRYDRADRLVEHRLPEGGRLEYAWGAGNALVGVTYRDDLDVATKLLVGESRRGFSYGNGVTYSGSIGADGRLEGYEYAAPIVTTTADTGWSLFREARAAGAGRVLFSAQLEYGATGKLLARRQEGARTTFAYDRLGRLLIAAAEGDGHQFFAYDADGELRGRNVDGVTRSFDPAAIRRDAGGLPNRAPTAFGDRELAYSPDRRLAVVRDGDRVVARYVHNAFGERIAKTVPRPGAAAASTSYFYLNNRLVGESSAGAPDRISRRYVYAHDVLIAVLDYPQPRELDRLPEAGEGEPGVFGRLGARLRGAWAVTFGDDPRVTYVHTNEIGTPIGATDAEARVVWRPDHLAYGAIRAHRATVDATASAFTLNLRLPGQYYDAETGWHDNYLRTYDPARGQYLEPDPLGPLPNLRSGRQLTQPYAYVNHDPLLNADPLGLVLFPFDGTANDRNDLTNVFHFADYYDSFNDYDRAAGIRGMRYYVNGVQTQGILDGDGPITGGAFARQMRERVNRGLGFLDEYIDGYLNWEIARRIQAGLPPLTADAPLVVDIDTVGFSRGAATAREFINRVLDGIEGGYYERRTGGCITLNLRMMALFETVLSHNTGDWWGGTPYRMVIPEEVDFVAHAVAMNEHRRSFPVELINPSNAAIGFNSDFRSNRIERGFIGAHSDIGGGYNGDVASGEGYDGGDLSDVALNWMVQQATVAGVRMRPLPADLRTVSNPIVHDPRRDRTWTYLGERWSDRDVRFRGVDRNVTDRMAWSHGLDIELYAGMNNALANTFIESRNLGWVWASEFYDTRVGDVRMCDYGRWLNQNYGMSWTCQ